MSKSLLHGVHPSLDLKGARTSLTPVRVRLLLALQTHGSISAAARAVKMSCKGAWDAIAALNTFASQPLVQTELGGAGGGGARLTETGRRLLAFYQALDSLHERVLSGAVDGDFNQLLQRVNNLMLRTSARNQYDGAVVTLQRGAVNSQVTLRLDGDDELVAIITNDSVETLALAVGASAMFAGDGRPPLPRVGRLRLSRLRPSAGGSRGARGYCSRLTSISLSQRTWRGPVLMPLAEISSSCPASGRAACRPFHRPPACRCRCRCRC